MFSQTVEYALRAMVCLASGDHTPYTSQVISGRTRLPGGYLSKVLRDLVLAKLVTSQRGPNGGFLIAREPGQISILDVVNAVDPIKRITHCPMGNPAHVRLCTLHERLDTAMGQVETALGATTLAELLNEPAGPHRCGAMGGDNTPTPLTLRGGGDDAAVRPELGAGMEAL